MIRVNSVNMAATETPMTAAAYQKVKALEAAKAAAPATEKVANTAMAKTLSLLGFADSKHRMSTPAEQAAVILFLLSGRSREHHRGDLGYGRRLDHILSVVRSE